jgi:tetratricopeptide (TPR) repeat protein
MVAESKSGRKSLPTRNPSPRARPTNLGPAEPVESFLTLPPGLRSLAVSSGLRGLRMRGLTLRPRRRLGIVSFLLALSTLCTAVHGQKPISPPNQSGGTYIPPQPVTVKVHVRDMRGNLLDGSAAVHLHSPVRNFDMRLPTRESSTAEFPSVMPGEYEIEVSCDGYQTTTERLSVAGFGMDISVFIYLHLESETMKLSSPPSGVVMTPKLQAEIDKGLDAMHKEQYDTAKNHFAKAVKIAPSNPDALYLLGTSELALRQIELARKQFEAVLNVDPTYEKALLAVGEMQLQSGDTTGAIVSLEKAFDLNGASWRTHLLLATAYAKAGRLQEAERHAARAAFLAKDKGAYATLLLGEIQNAEGKPGQARSSWETIITKFPNDPLVPKARDRLAQTSERQAVKEADPAANLPPPLLPVAALPSGAEGPWAPPDIDSMEYRLATNAPCQSDEVLARAQHRMTTQMENFEKFTATERIEHQEIDRYGMPGPARTKEFSYVVFVHPFRNHSVYLEESRDGGSDASAFPTSLATTGLNGLGVSILQPAYQGGFFYKCEGLTSLRGEAAWQVRFEENTSTSNAVREWRKNGLLYQIPIKGRIWVSASSFDLLRVETDLITPIQKLELSRDHLTVDYGPVNFRNGNARLWLPWSAEMYMELHGKRYHHKHFLTEYLLFAVDTSNKVHKPKEPPPIESDPAP